MPEPGVGAGALVAFATSGEAAEAARQVPLVDPAPGVHAAARDAQPSWALTWGVETSIVPPVRHIDDMVRQVQIALLDVGRCERATRWLSLRVLRQEHGAGSARLAVTALAR